MNLERTTIESDSLVSESFYSISRLLSRAGHVKSCLNLGGPSSKAKYESVTDSEEYREGKVKSTPDGE